MTDYYHPPITDFMRDPPKVPWVRSFYTAEANPWSRSGEIEAAIFFRGVIVASYGQIETKFAEILVRASRLPQYAALADEFPYKMKSRAKFIRAAAKIEPLSRYANWIEMVLRRFESAAELRHECAHGWMQVLPEWINFESFKPGKGGLIHNKRPVFMQQLERDAVKAARLSRIVQRFSSQLDADNLLPPL